MIVFFLSCISSVCEYEETKQSVAETEERLDALIERLGEIHPEETEQLQQTKAAANPKDTDVSEDSAERRKLQP